MNSPIMIGIGAGLVSAVLFASTMTGSTLAIILFYVTALPGLLAGLAWGTSAAFVSAIVGTALAGILLAPIAGLGYFLTLGLPIAILSYLALLARPSDDGAQDEQASPATMEWYPVGRLVTCAAFMAGGVAALTIPLFGMDIETYRTNLQELLEKTFLNQMPEGLPEGFDKDNMGPVMELLVRALPAASAIVWFSVMLLNLWTAARVATVSGRAIRPWPDISAMTYPPAVALGFVASLLGTFAPGILSIIATGFAGAFLLAYVLLGLVVLHVMAGKTAYKFVLLSALYVGIFVFGWFSLVVAFVGIGDPLMKFRERSINSGSTPPTDTD